MTSPGASQIYRVKHGIKKGNNAKLVAAAVQTVGSTCHLTVKLGSFFLVSYC